MAGSPGLFAMNTSSWSPIIRISALNMVAHRSNHLSFHHPTVSAFVTRCLLSVSEAKSDEGLARSIVTMSNRAVRDTKQYLRHTARIALDSDATSLPN